MKKLIPRPLLLAAVFALSLLDRRDRPAPAPSAPSVPAWNIDFPCGEKGALHSPELDKRLRRILADACAGKEGWDMCVRMQQSRLQVCFMPNMPETSDAQYASPMIVGRVQVNPDVDAPVIRLNPKKKDATLARFTLHEEEHWLQDGLHAFLPPDKYISPVDNVRLTRFKEAAGFTAEAVRLFKRELAGESFSFEGAEDQITMPALLAVARQSYAEDSASLTDGRLERRVFDAWFENQGMLDAYDAGAIQKYAVYAGRLSENPADAPPRMHLMIEDVLKIGAARGGVNYLMLPGFRHPDDPYYIGRFSPQNLAVLKVMDGQWEFMRRNNGAPPLPPRPPAGVAPGF